MPRQELKSRLRIRPAYFDELVRKLGETGTVAEERAVIRLPAHDIILSPEQQRRVNDYLAALSREPYSPPSDLVIDPELLNVLLQENKVVRVAEGVIFSSLAYEEMVERITGHIKRNGKISVAEVRDLFNTSRKYAVALMEYLDEQRITRRVGNERLLR
jgi:selenocysteine-specific elongation factor